MAYTRITVTNGVEVKDAPIGYSWTVLFFGGFPPLMRGDWQWGISLFIANVLTWGLAGLVVSFFYNKMYVKNLFSNGYKLRNLPFDLTEDNLRAYLGFETIPKV